MTRQIRTPVGLIEFEVTPVTHVGIVHTATETHVYEADGTGITRTSTSYFHTPGAKHRYRGDQTRLACHHPGKVLQAMMAKESRGPNVSVTFYKVEEVA